MTKVFLKFKDAVLKELILDKDPIRIGRKPENELSIDNMAVSGLHAAISEQDGEYFVEDMSSLNGTFVNGRKIVKHLLKNGDEILIGKHTVQFVSDEAPKAQAPAVQTKKPSMDQTMVLDPKVQQAFLGKSSTVIQTAANEVVGGFAVVEGSLDKKDYRLTERVTTIGKDQNAGIRLKGFFSPKVAALVNRKKEGYFIAPADSKKTLKINGKETAERYELKDGDIIELSGCKLQFYIKD